MCVKMSTTILTLDSGWMERTMCLDAAAFWVSQVRRGPEQSPLDSYFGLPLQGSFSCVSPPPPKCNHICSLTGLLSLKEVSARAPHLLPSLDTPVPVDVSRCSLSCYLVSHDSRTRVCSREGTDVQTGNSLDQF